MGMNWNQIRGNWKQWRGKSKEKWRALTDDDLQTVVGQRDRMIGLLQDNCGFEKGQAERETSTTS